MATLEIAETFDLFGSVPNHIKSLLEKTVQSISSDVFFDGQGERLKVEIKRLDVEIAKVLSDLPLTVERNYRPFDDNNFNIDLAVPDHELLVEIEKGKLPRLELDILKLVNACVQNPEKWKYGALVVPASYIKLPLAGLYTPYVYLKNHLKYLVQSLFSVDSEIFGIGEPIEGIFVIGYYDPRAGSIESKNGIA